MRIAILTSYLSSRGGGLFSAVHSLARALLGHGGIDVRIFGMMDEGASTDLRSWAGVEVSAFETGGLKSLASVPRMLEAIGLYRPDVIHMHGLWTAISIVSMLAGRKMRIPRIISPHGMLDSWALRQRRIKKILGGMLFERSNLTSARCLHAIAAAELVAIRQFGLRNPICLIPNAVELPRSSFGVLRRERGKFVGEGDVVLVYLGRFHPKKGLENLLQGWALAQRKHESQSRHWRLKIAGGEGAYQAKIRSLVDQLGMSESVELLGPVFGLEKERFFENAHGLILPSLSEGLPMIVIEAWAHGLPTLITKHCNVPEGILAGAAIEVGTDPASICDGIVSFMGMNSAEYRAMAVAARQLVETRFSMGTVAAAMKEVYLWAAGGGSYPATVCLQKQ